MPVVTLGSPLNQNIQYSQWLYEIYGKIHTVDHLTEQEHRILEHISQKEVLGSEHQEILRRIQYILKRKAKQQMKRAMVA